MAFIYIINYMALSHHSNPLMREICLAPGVYTRSCILLKELFRFSYER